MALKDFEFSLSPTTSFLSLLTEGAVGPTIGEFYPHENFTEDTLSIGNVYCRGWKFKDTSGRRVMYSYLSKTYQPDFSVIPSQKAVSSRLWVRTTGNSFDNSVGSSYALTMRAEKTAYSQSAENGYKFVIKNDNSFLLGSDEEDINNLMSKSFPPIPGVDHYNKWVHLRMDLLPIFDLDGVEVLSRLDAYVQTTQQAGTEIWTKVGHKYIEKVAPINRGISRSFRDPSILTANSLTTGFYIASRNHSCFVDNFNVLLKDV